MTNKEAFDLIGNRVNELVKIPDIQAKMLEIANNKSKEEAEKWIYMAAIATLAGF